MVAAGEAERLAELIGPAVSARASRPGLGGGAGQERGARAGRDRRAATPSCGSLAHRWAKAAPAADLLWEFHPSRQANPQAAGAHARRGGFEFALDKLMLGLRVPPAARRGST